MEMAGHEDPARRLQRLQFRVEVWRGLAPKHEPMPPELRSEAVELACIVGEEPVRSALAMAPGSLQGRRRRRDTEAVPAFVEVGTVLAGATSETIVEVSDGTGARLTIRLGVGSTLDVGRIVAAFRRGSR
jgi:hypothetical protein